MNKYVAYFDESGVHADSEFVIVGGIVVKESEINQLAQEWQENLNSWEIQWFHMTDFENRQKHYESWNDDERKTRLNILLEIVYRYSQQTIGAVVVRRSFDKIFSDRSKSILGDAWGLAMFACLTKLAETARAPEVDAQMSVVISRGAPGSDAIRKIWTSNKDDGVWRDHHRIHSVEFLENRSLPQLQAADIVCYEVYKQALRQFGC